MTVPITVTQFKTAFTRSFVFVNDWIGTTAYDVNDVVATINNNGNTVFWRCLVANTNSQPTSTNTNWQLILQSGNFVLNSDIQQAITITSASFFNASLPWNTTVNQDEIAFGYCTAHLLACTLKNVGANANAQQKINSVAVGNVHQAFQNVDNVNPNSPLYHFTTTWYGQQYLAMASPLGLSQSFRSGQFITNP